MDINDLTKVKWSECVGRKYGCFHMQKSKDKTDN